MSKTSPTRGGGFQNRGPLKAVISKDYLIGANLPQALRCDIL